MQVNLLSAPVSSVSRRRVIVLVAALAMFLGVISPASVSNAANTFKAPTGLKVSAVAGTNGLKVTWGAAAPLEGTGAPDAYVVKYGTSSSNTTTKMYSVTGNNPLIYVTTGLSTSTTYSVWVAAADGAGRPVSPWSAAVKSKTSSYKYKAPVEIFAVNSTKTTVEVAWRTVTGAPAYRLQAVGGGKTAFQSTGSDGTAVFKGLHPGTSYTFTVSVMQPATTSVPGEVKMSPESSKKAVRSTTAASNLDAPTELKAQDPDHSSVRLTWKAPAGFDVDNHDVRVDYAEDQNMKENFKQQWLSGATGATLKSLSSNTNYYVRVTVVSKPDANGKRTTVSDRTESILAKTRSPKGFIAGKVTGVSATVLRDYVVAAYSATTGDVNQQVSPNSSGDYRMELRPGNYFVQAIYLGAGNFTTRWARSGNDGARTRNDPAGAATSITVTIGRTPTSVPTITVGQGGTIKGTVSCPGKSSTDSCSVDVAAISDWGGTPAVLAQARSDSDGNYSLDGLAQGTYTVRFKHTEERFKIGEAAGTVAAAGSTDDLDKTLSVRSFIRTYAVTMAGTKKVGRTLSISSRAPLAAEFPTVRAFVRYNWQVNGVTRSTSPTFKPSPSYRGDTVRALLTFYRFGFDTVTQYSKSYRLG